MAVSGPFIVVAPLATLPNWVREFEKWLPSHPVVRFHGTQSERDEMMAGPLNPKNKKKDDFPVIVTSYEVAIRDEKRLNKIGEFTYLVVDEGQRLKNHRCTLISSLKRIRSSNRLLLSGTPIQNNLDVSFGNSLVALCLAPVFGVYLCIESHNHSFDILGIVEFAQLCQSCYLRRLVHLPILVWIQKHWPEDTGRNH
jgi:superfamily II DNA or RNA helicase